jgi:predicted ATPase/DNA-binding XRE family transcriptional regulator
LRRHRIAAGLSQEALAQRARMSIEGISALERGFRRNPQRETLALLAGALALDDNQRRAFEAAGTRSTYPRTGASVTVGPWQDTQAPTLPVALSAFVGRDAELRDIAEMVKRHRLVTITGAPGVGKTQTALHLARTYDDRNGGVQFVALASLRDGSLVPSAIASAVGVGERPDRSLLDTLIGYFKNKALLLVLDNCEHVIEQAASVAEGLLTGCSGLRILATSREPLKAAGERRYRMPSLKEADAVALFEDRAAAVDPTFKLSSDNAAHVADICRRLDGIPLAIELAAARVNVLPVSELRKRLDDRFQILAGSARSLVPRQRTMRAAIDWGYELLTGPERRIFERLAIFAGGCTLATATSVCNGEGVGPTDVFDVLGSLVDKSLVNVELGWSEARYGLLQSFAQYGREKLIAREELQSVAHRHAMAQLELARRTSALRPHHFEAAQEIWVAEQENLRAAIAWALLEDGDALLGRQIVAEVCYWEYFSPGERRRWLDAALSPRCEMSPELLAALHKANAVVCFHLREYEGSVESCEAALTYYRAIEDSTSIAQIETARGHALLNLRRRTEARVVFEAALPVARAGESPTALAGMLSGLALVTDDITKVRQYAAEARRIHEKSGNRIGVAFTLINQGIKEGREGNEELALANGTEAVTIAAGLPAFARVNVLASALHNISHSFVRLGRYDEAEQRVREKLELAREYGLDYYIATALEELVVIDSLQRKTGAPPPEWFVHAARILGFVDAFLRSAKLQRYEESKPRYDAVVEMLLAAIGAERTSQLMSEGASLSQAEAIAEIAALT